MLLGVIITLVTKITVVGSAGDKARGKERIVVAIMMKNIQIMSFRVTFIKNHSMIVVVREDLKDNYANFSAEKRIALLSIGSHSGEEHY